MKKIVLIFLLVILIGCSKEEIDKCEDRFNEYNYEKCVIIEDMYLRSIPYIMDHPHIYNVSEDLKEAYSIVCSFGWNSLLSEWNSCNVAGCLKDKNTGEEDMILCKRFFRRDVICSKEMCKQMGGRIVPIE